MEAHIGPKMSARDERGVHWSRLLSRYHWFVLAVAALGWVFDRPDSW